MRLYTFCRRHQAVMKLVLQTAVAAAVLRSTHRLHRCQHHQPRHYHNSQLVLNIHLLGRWNLTLIHQHHRVKPHALFLFHCHLKHSCLFIILPLYYLCYLASSLSLLSCPYVFKIFSLFEY